MHHLRQLLSARRGEHAHARHLRQQRHVVHAVVARPVRARDAGAVETEDDRQPVQGDVVDDLVPRPVEERRVDRHDRPEAAHRHPGRGGDGVLLGDPDVEAAVGETILERQQAGRPWHRRGDGDEPGVGFGLLDDRLGERLGVPRGHRLGWPDERVEHGRVVEVLLVVVLGRRVAATLLGEDVHQDRPVLRQRDRVVQRVLHLLDVVTVERADVPHAQRLEERRRLQELADAGLERVHRRSRLVADDGQRLEELLEATLAPHVHRVETDVGERVGQLAGHPVGQARMRRTVVASLAVGRQVRHGRRVRAAVVVEHHDHPSPTVADVVQRLVGHAAGQRPVAEHRHDVAMGIGAEVTGDRHPVRVRQHGGGMAVLDVVVHRLLAARVAGQPARLTELLELGLASGDDLVHVRLVAGVPDDRIGRRVEDPVQGQRQLDGAEVRAEVPGVVGHRRHDEVPDLAGQLVELARR